MQPDATQGQIIEIEDDSENDDFQLDEFFEIGAFEDPFNRDDLLESTLPRVPSPTTSHRACVDRVLEVFPDISRDHLQQLYDARITTPTTTRDDDVFGDLVRQIADAEKYPKEKDRLRELKRKISEVLNSDQEDAATWAAQGRGTATWDYSQAAYVHHILGADVQGICDQNPIYTSLAPRVAILLSCVLFIMTFAYFCQSLTVANESAIF